MIKSFLRAFLIVLLVSGFGLFGNLSVQASTDITGVISSDTAWTKADSPYSLTGNVLVYNGVTLTIEAGVTINLNDYYIMVNGTLRAQGSGADKIYFNGGKITFTPHSNSWNEQTGSGCIIENANLDSTDVEINFASPKINGNSISKIVIGGSTILTNNTIRQEITQSYIVDSPVVSGNTILEGGSFSASGSAVVSHNSISGTFRSSNSSGVVSYNIVSGSLIVTGSALVSNNIVSGGLEVYGSVIASNNNVSGSLRAGVSATVTNNTILGGVVVPYGDSVTISNNIIDGGIDLSPAGNYKVNASILNNTITGGEIGVRLAPTTNIFLYASSRSDAIISDNIIYDCVTAGIKVNGAGDTQGGHTPLYNTAIIKGNTIINTNCGIDVTGREDVRNNIIANNEIGINGGSTIEGNLIINNTYGIIGGDEIRNNTIVNNSVGVKGSFTSLVYNNIYNNSEYNFHSTSSTNANATYNWWGTTDTQAINQTIYDFKNDFYLGKVNFNPFLTEPNPETPPIQNPVIPEFTSWIFLSLFITATLLVIFCKRKYLKTENT